MSFPGQTCAQCNKAIYGAPKKIGSKSYHDACLACSVCKAKLQLSTYKQYNSAFLCDGCYRVQLRSVNDSAGLVSGGIKITAILAPAPKVAKKAKGEGKAKAAKPKKTSGKKGSKKGSGKKAAAAGDAAKAE